MLSQPFGMNPTLPKLLCVSVNPAVDRRILVPRLALHTVNRASGVLPTAGGKSAHVAYAAKALGADVHWLAFTGGTEGEFCRAGVESRGVHPITVPISGRTRMTMEIIDESRAITELLEPGPVVSEEEQRKFREAFAASLSAQPFVVISGSLTAGLPQDFYAQLIAVAPHHRCHVFLDTSGSALTESLAAKPDVIKPNRQEAEAILDRKIETPADARAAAEELRSRGPQTVIISLGDRGAIACDGSSAVHAHPPRLEAISTVGSGDSFVAGWAFAAATGKSFRDALRLATACGSANCLATSPGVISADAVERLLREVVLTEL